MSHAGFLWHSLPIYQLAFWFHCHFSLNSDPKLEASKWTVIWIGVRGLGFKYGRWDINWGSYAKEILLYSIWKK